MNKVSDLISESKEIMKLTENWQFRQKGQDSWLPAKVPGSVHTDLLANQQVNDPFYGKNELDQQWSKTGNMKLRLMYLIKCGSIRI